MEQKKNEYFMKCEVFETRTNELKTKLQSSESESEVNKLSYKGENLEELLRTALQDANLLENSSQLDQRNDTLEC